MTADLTILSMKRNAGQGSSCSETVTVRVSVFRGNGLETLTADISDFPSCFVMYMPEVEVSIVRFRPILSSSNGHVHDHSRGLDFVSMSSPNEIVVPAVIKKLAWLGEDGHSRVFSVVTSQSHGQSDMSMRIVVAWQVSNHHLLVFLKRQFHDIDHEIYAGLHEFEISTVDIQREPVPRCDILLVVGVLPIP